MSSIDDSGQSASWFQSTANVSAGNIAVLIWFITTKKHQQHDGDDITAKVLDRLFRNNAHF